ncbi:gamma-glutamyltranspeptidase [Streptomyces sp. t39]|nr:gamma-glutamyltranspeptidase [Streptomyces sp. t39]
MAGAGCPAGSPARGRPGWTGASRRSAWRRPCCPSGRRRRRGRCPRGWRRPRTTLTPSIALRDGEPVLAFGTPGGDQQDQWQLHFLLALEQLPHVRGGWDLQGAVDAPNWHNESFPGSFHPRGMRPGSLTVESRTAPETVADLRRRGHDVTVGGAWSEGRLCAVARDPRTGVLSAAANPRGMQGYAVGR